jgi:hypothetical protein
MEREREDKREKKKKERKGKKPTSHGVPACSPVTLLPPHLLLASVLKKKRKRYEMRAYAHVER